VWRIILVGWLAAQLPDDPAINRLRDCVERSDAKCAARAVAAIPAEKSRGCADCLELEARAFLLLRQKQEAIDAIAGAIRLDSAQYSYLMTQGRIYQKFGAQIEAIRSFLLADKLQPRSAGAFYYLGMSFVMLKEYERGQRHFQHALELEPQNDKAEFMLGIIDEFYARSDNARSHFEKALAAQPENPFYHLHYGILLGRFTNDLPAGVREIQVANKLKPNYAPTHYNLGRLYRQMNRWEDARKELETAVKLQPGLAEAWYQLGTVYRQLGMAGESSKAFDAFRREKAKEDDAETDPIESTLIQRESH
jgi:tetratricopeptide (TPR) repeat protein